MAIRTRANFAFGVIDAALSSEDTTISSPELASLPAVTSGVNFIPLVLDPSSIGGAPEIVWVTAHTASATTATIARGQEGTSARSHADGIAWIHGPTASDFSAFDPDDPTVWGADLGFDYEFNGVSTSLPPGWSWVNQGAATYEENMGGGSIILPQSSTENWRGIFRTLSGAPSTWTLVGKFSWQLSTNNWNRVGLFLRDSSTDRIAFMGSANDNDIVAERWQSPTGLGNGSQIGAANNSSGFRAARGYFRIKKNSPTSYDFAFSTNCSGWRSVGTDVNLSTFMTPDQFGFMCNTSSNTANPGSATCHWIRLR